MSTSFCSFFASFFKNFSAFIIILPFIGKKYTLKIKKYIDKNQKLCYTCLIKYVP